MTTWEPWDSVKYLTIVDDYINKNRALTRLRSRLREQISEEVDEQLADKTELEVLELIALDPLCYRWNFPSAEEEDGVNADDLENLRFLDEKNDLDNYKSCKVYGSEREKEQIFEVLAKYADVFTDIGKQPVKVEPMKLQVKNINEVNPVFCKPVRMGNQQAVEYLEQLMEKMIVANIVTETTDVRWNSRIFMVDETKDGVVKYRMTLDYRPLNQHLVNIASRVPKITQLIQETRGMKCLGKFDLTKYFYQIPLDVESQYLTAFTLPNGKRYQFTRAPMGVSTSAIYAQHIANVIFGENAAYMDDVLVKGRDFKEFLIDLELKLKQAQHYGLKLSANKTILNSSSIEYLGRSLDENASWLTSDTKEAVKSFAIPTTIGELRSFLGLCNYAREYVQNFSIIAQPLYLLLKKPDKMDNKQFKKSKIKWSTESEEAFMKLKRAIVESKGLGTLDYDKPIYMNTDACNKGWGAILYQYTENNEKNIVSMLSGKFNSRESNWSTLEQECYAIYKAITSWRHFILGKEFHVYCDHRNLSFILNSETKKVLRWKLALMEYQFMIHHIPGAENTESDILSRLHGGDNPHGVLTNKFNLK